MVKKGVEKQTSYSEILIYYVITSFVREAWRVTEYRI
jgi:hypothetical protein